MIEQRAAYRRIGRLCACIAMALALLAIPSRAHADDLDEFLFAREAYVNGDFQQTFSRFQALLRHPDLRQDLIEPSRRYIVATLVSLQQSADAVALLERMFREDPDLAFGVQEFSPAVLAVVASTRERLTPELNRIRAQRLVAAQTTEARRVQERALLRDLATREVVTARTPRWLMFMPMGIGQYANDSPGLGAVFTGTQLIAIAGIVTTWALEASIGPPCEWPGGPARTTCFTPIIALNTASWILLGASAAGGIVQANLAYVPERSSIRRRPIPPELDTLHLSFAPTSDRHGAALTVGFRF